jgi:hypothetical protein
MDIPAARASPYVQSAVTTDLPYRLRVPADVTVTRAVRPDPPVLVDDPGDQPQSVVELGGATTTAASAAKDT